MEQLMEQLYAKKPEATAPVNTSLSLSGNPIQFRTSQSISKLDLPVMKKISGKDRIQG